MPLRKYKSGDPGSTGAEIVNSRPIQKPPPQVTMDVTPHGDVVTTTTTYASYSWDDVEPTMYHHEATRELTFTGTLRPDALGRSIIEWYWDFGDGTNALGQVVTKTYANANPDTIVHLRATDTDGSRVWASMNLMLVPPPPDPNVPPENPDVPWIDPTANQDWLDVKVTHGTWTDVDTEYADWQAVKDDTP